MIKLKYFFYKIVSTISGSCFSYRRLELELGTKISEETHVMNEGR